MINKEDITCEYIKEPLCSNNIEAWYICWCTELLQKRLINNITHRTLKEKDNWWIIFEWACGRANTIIGITIPTMNQLCKELNQEPISIIKDNINLLTQIIQSYLWDKDPYLVSTNQYWNKGINRLEITLQRWIKKDDKEEILQKYEKNL